MPLNDGEHDMISFFVPDVLDGGHECASRELNENEEVLLISKLEL